MVDCLKVPHTLAGFRIQAYDAGRKEVVAMPMPTIVVTGGRFCRQVNKPSFRVMRDLCPDGRVARVGPRVILPCINAQFSWLWDGVECPKKISCGSIVSTDIARGVNP